MLKPEGDQTEDGRGAGKRDRQTEREQALKEGWSQAAGTGKVFLEREGLGCPGDTRAPGRVHMPATAGPHARQCPSSCSQALRAAPPSL